MKRVNFVAAEAIDLAAPRHSLAMTAGNHLEASVFKGGVIEKEQRGNDARSDRGQIFPIGEILMKHDFAAFARALERHLLGEQLDVFFAHRVLTRIDQARIVGPSMQLVAEMRERFQRLHQVRIVRLPLDDGFETALNFEHVTAERVPGAALFGEQPLHQCLASITDGAHFIRIENRSAHHEAALVEVGFFARIQSEGLGHRGTGSSCHSLE